MEGDDNKKFYEQKHKINVTLSSQERINGILENISDLHKNNPIDSPEKQKCYLDLLRQYLIAAIPYLSNGDGKTYMETISNFKIKKRSIVVNGNQRYSFQFDPLLDSKMNLVLLQLQQKLRPILTRIEQDDDSGDPYN